MVIVRLPGSVGLVSPVREHLVESSGGIVALSISDLDYLADILCGNTKETVDYVGRDATIRNPESITYIDRDGRRPQYDYPKAGLCFPAGLPGIAEGELHGKRSGSAPASL